MAKKKSKSMSFEGYSLKVWAKHNKGNLRLVLSGCLGLIAMGLTDVSVPWAIALGGVVTTGSKLVLDAFDYFLSEVEI